MPRHTAARLGIPSKRADYLFSKWLSKGWYDYGTVIDGGWLTDAGDEAASEIQNKGKEMITPLSAAEIKDTRERLGLTQTELAERLGLSAQQRIHEWETGKRRALPYLRLALDALEYSDAIAAAKTPAPVAVESQTVALAMADRLSALLPLAHALLRTLEFERALLEQWGDAGQHSWIPARRMGCAGAEVAHAAHDLRRLCDALRCVAADAPSGHESDPRTSGGVMV